MFLSYFLFVLVFLLIILLFRRAMLTLCNHCICCAIGHSFMYSSFTSNISLSRSRIFSDPVLKTSFTSSLILSFLFVDSCCIFVSCSTPFRWNHCSCMMSFKHETTVDAQYDPFRFLLFWIR